MNTAAVRTIAVESPSLPPCECLLSLLRASRNVRLTLARLMRLRLFSETQLAALTVLNACDPEPTTLGALSREAGVCTEEVVFAIDALVAHGLLEFRPGLTVSRDDEVNLTARGRTVAGLMVHLFMEAADRLTRGLPASSLQAVGNACNFVAGRARALQEPRRVMRP